MQDPTPEWTRYIEELEESAARLRKTRDPEEPEGHTRGPFGTAIGARLEAALSWLQGRDIRS